MLRDFLGTPFAVDDYVASGGAGNGRAEYGMILYKVIGLDPKLRLVRLAVSYPTHSEDNVVVRVSKVTVQSTSKYVVVHPSQEVIALFERALAGTQDKRDGKLISKWIHGTSSVFG